MQINKEIVENAKRIMKLREIMMNTMILLTVMKIHKIAIQVKMIILMIVKTNRWIAKNNSKYQN